MSAPSGLAADRIVPAADRIVPAALRLAVVAALTVTAAEPIHSGFAPGARLALTAAALGVPAVTGALVVLAVLVGGAGRLPGGAGRPARGAGRLPGPGGRLPGAARAAITGVVLVAATLLALRPGAALLRGPQLLLTAARPVEPAGAELAWAVLAVGLAGLVAAELALRPRHRFAPALPAFVLVVLGLASSGARPAPSWVAPALVALTGLLLVAPSVPPTGPAAGRTTARTTGRAVTSGGGGHTGGVPARGGGGVGGVAAGRAGSGRWLAAGAGALRVGCGLAVVCLLAAQGAGLVPTGDPEDRFDARDLVRAPTPPTYRANPMARLFALQNEQRELFRITAPAELSGEPIRLVALPVFDGLSWNAADEYRPAGHVLPAVPDAAGQQPPTPRSITITMGADRDLLPWLPAIGRAVRASTAGLLVDEASGGILRPDTGPAGTVDGTVGLDVAGGPLHATGTYRTAVPAPPAYPLPLSVEKELARYPDLAGLAPKRTPDGKALGRLAALETMFADGGFQLAVGADRAAGAGLFAIDRLLRTRTGTAEQFASAFALAALRLDYDARVVLGFRPGDATAGRTVRTDDIHAWPEVRLAGYGWVPFKPFPRITSTGQPAPGTGSPSPADARPDPFRDALGDALANKPLAGQPTGPVTTTRSAAPEPGSPAGAVAMAVGGLLIVLVGMVPAAKWIRRRRRRRAPTAAARVDGAWQETVDRLIESGVAARPSLTRHEVGLAARTALPRARLATLDELRQLADAVAFSGGAVDEADVSRAWQLADRVRRQAGAAVPPHRRVLVPLDVRPLLRRGLTGGAPPSAPPRWSARRVITRSRGRVVRTASPGGATRGPGSPGTAHPAPPAPGPRPRPR